MMTDVPLLETMQRKGSALLPPWLLSPVHPLSHLRVSLISRYITGRMDGRPSSRKVGRMEDGGDSGKGRATTLSLVASSRYGLYILSDFLPSSNNECSRHHAPNRVTVPHSPPTRGNFTTSRKELRSARGGGGWAGWLQT